MVMNNKIQRQSNIELCRIVSILMILLLHSDFAVFGWPSSWSEPNIPLLALESFCIIGVNVFVLISGYFSIKVKRETFLKLFYICLFCAIVKIIFDIIVDGAIHFYDFLFISKTNWFIPSYIGLIIISPVLNAFCEKSSQKQLLTVIVSLLVFECYFGFIPSFSSHAAKGINHGLSVFHLSFLYLIARYIRLYDVPQGIRRFSGLIYLICTFVLTSFAYLLIITNHVAIQIDGNNLVNQIFDYTNPLVIISAICFFLTFLKVKMNTMDGVNYVAQSVLTVLILNTSVGAIRFIYPQYHWIFDHNNGLSVILLWTALTIIQFCCFVGIDQLRIYSYNAIRNFFKIGKHE